MKVRRIVEGEDIPVGLSEFVREKDQSGYYLLYFRPTANGPYSVAMLYHDQWSIAFKREVTQ